jgi:hypothetical protein
MHLSAGPERHQGKCGQPALIEPIQGRELVIGLAVVDCLSGNGFEKQIFGANEQVRGRGQTYMRGIGLKVMWEKPKNRHTSPATAE